MSEPGAEIPFPRPAHRRAVANALLPWFRERQRDLPWRTDRHPYRVWISEIMLQQTRVDTVVDYFHRFLAAFPDVHALAAAPLDAVLKQWEGLGYYARARNLHRAACLISRERGGVFPRTAEQWRALPGIGAYTSAAIASLSAGEPVAVLDGNVIRVLSRLAAFDGNVKKAGPLRTLQSWAQDLLVRDAPGDFNEAMMELGATVCLPAHPRCGSCPLAGVCTARERGTPTAFPVTPPRAKVPHKVVGAGVVVDARGRILIARRLESAMLGGLWEFPGGTLEDGETLPGCIRRELREELGIETAIGERLRLVRHAYSHFTIELHVHWARRLRGQIRALECSAFQWVSASGLADFAFSRADQFVVQDLQTMRPAELKRVRAGINP